MHAVRILILVSLLCFPSAPAQSATVNGWQVLESLDSGMCAMRKTVGSATFQFEPAHGKERTRITIHDAHARFSSGQAGMSLLVPEPGGAGPYNAFSGFATAKSENILTVGVYGDEEVRPWLEKASEFRISASVDYRLSFPLSGQKEAMAMVYECLRTMAERQEDAREDADWSGW